MRRAPGRPARVAAGCVAAGCVAVLALAAACRRESAVRNGPPAEAARLAGVWDATFVLTTPPLGLDTASLRRSRTDHVRGVLAFVPNHWLTAAVGPADGQPTPPSAHGSYDVDFSPFGFDPRESDQVPAAVATVIGSAARDAAAGADSVALVLGPAGDRTRLQLDGVWRADSITGTWHVESASRGSATGAGRFTLVSRQPPAAPRFGPRSRRAVAAGTP